MNVDTCKAVLKAVGHTRFSMVRNVHAMGATRGASRRKGAVHDDDGEVVVVDGTEGKRVHKPSVRRNLNVFREYRVGNLVRIEMNNFLTFANTVVLPGPRLNLIIGPNGTGKSSIVNAVCIVFGGKLSLLGRGGDLASFVRHGASDASVEVAIYDPQATAGIRKVRRQFDSDGKSVFFLDGKKSAAAAITSINQRYDIQLDNLSQFMPQEKIAEFVNLHPQELLAMTVRSLGGTRQAEKFKELMTLDSSLRSFIKRLNVREEKLLELKRQNEAASSEVDAYKQQKIIKKRVRLMERILPHRQADELRSDYIEILTERKQVEEELEQLQERIRQITMGPLKEYDIRRKAAKQEVSAAREAVQVLEERTVSEIHEADDRSLHLASQTTSLRDIEKTAERQQREISQAEQRIQMYKAKINEVSANRNDAEDNRQISTCERERDSLRQQLVAEETTKSSLDQMYANAARAIKHHNNRINSLGDLREQRIQMLHRDPRFRGTAECAQLVRELVNANRFRGKVYGPVVAEISCDNQYHARILESCVSGFLMGAFVTEHAKDSRLLIQECKKRLSGWSPDTITAPTDDNDNVDIEAVRAQVPERPADARLRHLGIICMVSDIFQAADAVRVALNAQAGLHNIHVGDERADQFLEELRYENGVSVWYTPTARCAVIRSRYDRSVRNLRVETRFRNMTGKIYSGSLDEVQREKARLLSLIRNEEANMTNAKSQLTSLNERMQGLVAQRTEVETTIRTIVERRRTRDKLMVLLNRSEDDYKSLRSRRAVLDVEEQKKALLRTVHELEKQSLVESRKLPTSLALFRDTLVKLDDVSARRVLAERQFEEEKNKHSSMGSKVQELTERRENKKAEARSAKAAWKTKQREAEQSISEQEIEQNQEECAQLLEKESSWLEHEIERMHGRIDGLTTGGAQVLEQYEQREKKIQLMEREISGERKGHEERQKGYETDKKNFLTWLERGVGSMRTKFSELYSRLGCAGDLELTNKDGDCFGELSLQILVSYREGAALRPISASANSGGEKMCCTMLFCFSLLQDEERMPPFVMVDELNQGLDPVNEMKIMTIMFEDAERGAAPQSFVVTPKLLPNLPFQDATKTHIIFNGTIFKGDVAVPTAS